MRAEIPMRPLLVPALLLLSGTLGCAVDAPTVDPNPDVPALDTPRVGSAADTGGWGEDPSGDTAVPQAPTFANPVVAAAADAHVSLLNGQYLLLHTDPGGVVLQRSASLVGRAPWTDRTIWTPSSSTPHEDLASAPELHRVSGGWWIYYAAVPKGQPNESRIYALRADGDDPFTASWTEAGPVQMPPGDEAGAGPTVVSTGEATYLVWTGREYLVDLSRRVYLAPLVSPLETGPQRLLLSSPMEPWERAGARVNEAPAVAVIGDRVVVAFGASSCTTDQRAVGALTAATASDLMDASSWTKHSGPLLSTNAAQNVFAPGHLSFVSSLDGEEQLVTFDASSLPGRGCDGERGLHVARVRWTSGEVPTLGPIYGPLHPQALPTGEL